MAELRVSIELLGVGEVGLWCPDCALPSGVVVWFTLTMLAGEQPSGLRSMTTCTRCRRRNLERGG